METFAVLIVLIVIGITVYFFIDYNKVTKDLSHLNSLLLHFTSMDSKDDTLVLPIKYHPYITLGLLDTFKILNISVEMTSYHIILRKNDR